MTKRLEFFYDYVSPYSYLANSQVVTLDAEIVYRPMLLGGLMHSIGNKPPASLKSRGTYLFQDVQRWADHYKIPYLMNPAFPVNTVKALRGALVAQEGGELHKIHQSLFDAVWVHQLDINDDDILSGLLADAGLAANEVMKRISSEEIKSRLRDNTDEAAERGAFGAPTFFVDGEMFFGNDRLHFVREALR